MQSMSLSATGLARIRQFEGFISAPVATPDGHWVVGHGHVRVGAPGMAVNRQQAAELLSLDLAGVEHAVNEAITVKVTQRQFDALVSFAFSVGFSAFAHSSVPRLVNAGSMVAAACAIDSWRKVEEDGELQPSAALVRRRAAEKALFLADVKLPASASALARPQLDHAAAILGAPFGAEAALTPTAPAKRLTEILMSEPATAELLLTIPAPLEDEIDDDEIHTGHAKPTPRPADATPRVGLKALAEHAGLFALLAFGFGLLGLAGAVAFSGRGDVVDMLGASALAAPGLAAVAMSAFGLATGSHAAV